MNKIKIVTALLPAYLDKTFIYDDGGLGVSVGDVIQVPFGRQILPAICIKAECFEAKDVGANIGVDIEKVKCVKRVFQKSVFTQNAIRFFLKFGEYNMIENRRLFDLITPSFIYSEKNTVLNGVLAVSDNAEVNAPRLYKTKPAAQKVAKLLEAIRSQPNACVTAARLISEYGFNPLFLEKMTRAGIVEIINSAPQSKEEKIIHPLKTNIHFNLSKEQAEAVDYVCKRLTEFNPVLLHGVTGSGKTEVYISLVERVISSTNKQALIMLPEIAMMSVALDRLKTALGLEAVVWHSSVSGKNKVDQVSDIASGKARVVVGARSAALLPFKEIGIIIVDEEHDASYKQDEIPAYNARDMAVLRASIENCPVLLCSATPSTESYLNASSAKYGLFRLNNRFKNATFPTIKIVDTKEANFAGKTSLAEESVKAIREVLSRGEQVIVFLNRRGYSRMIACKDCGFIYECKNCDNKLVYHKGQNCLKCHYCLYSIKIPQVCVGCGKAMKMAQKGLPGLEKIKEEVEDLFPGARIGMMSADTMSKDGALKEFLQSVSEGRVDIIVGTQIAAKGFNFQKLRLVVALNVNTDEIQGDLRIFERTYQLLVQVAGRAGRFGGGSLMIIQTNSPDNPVLQSMISGIDDHFYKEELKRRRDSFLPPFSKQIAIISLSSSQEKAREGIEKIHSKALNELRNERYRGVKVFGPTENSIHRLKTKYRYHILLQGNSRTTLASFAACCLEGIQRSGDPIIKIDVDPMSVL